MSTLTLSVVLIATACVLVLVSLASMGASSGGALPDVSSPQPALAGGPSTQAAGRESCAVSGDLVGDANPADVYSELCR